MMMMVMILVTSLAVNRRLAVRVLRFEFRSIVRCRGLRGEFAKGWGSLLVPHAFGVGESEGWRWQIERWSQDHAGGSSHTSGGSTFAATVVTAAVSRRHFAPTDQVTGGRGLIR